MVTQDEGVGQALRHNLIINIKKKLNNLLILNFNCLQLETVYKKVCT